MTRTTIGGPLDYSKFHTPPQPTAASALPYDQQARDHFALLPHDQQRQSIQRLAASGMSDHTIAVATGLAVEQIRRLIAEHANA